MTNNAPDSSNSAQQAGHRSASTSDASQAQEYTQKQAASGGTETQSNADKTAPNPQQSPHVSSLDRFVGSASKWLWFLEKPAQWLDLIIHRARNLPETNFNMAQEMVEEGLYLDAILRLKVALWLAPEYPRAHYLLGCCYISRGEQQKAIPVLRKAVALDPSDREAMFMLATIDASLLQPEQQPTTIPYTIARQFFANWAQRYEREQLDAGYRGHQLVDAALWDVLDPRRNNYKVLDLGCGTGLCGSLMAEHAEVIVGVDFSQEMLDQAKTKRRPDRRRVYTETLLEDIRNYSADIETPQFDAIVAAHVFQYVGELSMVFRGMAAGLLPGGVAVFQVEPYQMDGYYGILPGVARFGHSYGYVQHMLSGVGLELVSHSTVNVLPDRQMIQYIARRPGAE